MQLVAFTSFDVRGLRVFSVTGLRFGGIALCVSCVCLMFGVVADANAYV